MKESLVSSSWLNENLDRPDLIVLDASPRSNVAGLSVDFGDVRIKGARFFDLKEVFIDPNGAFPATFPTADQFEVGCRNLGINTSSEIIVYDNVGVYTSPRVWWMFKAMGHDNVAVLDGGLPDWIESGFQTEAKVNVEFPQGNFQSRLQPERIKNIEFIESNVQLETHLLIDARTKGRFDGTADEPRKGLRSGHIPNSINVPFSRVLENGKFKSKDELKLIFKDVLTDDRSLIFSCGSGVTACIVLLAVELIAQNRTSIYDGSWTEWATLKLS